MTMMGIPLDQIYEERKKLEGIGLVNVYKRKKDEDIIYMNYKGHLVIDFPKMMFSVFISYNRIGKHRYLQLKEAIYH
ncbi:hypothetical protein KHA80_16510 [Anaerobacillus sp. HL2]|nr:hypothetical protein KHA80_16510 [Anaerobacillus sp. HL2]